MSIPAPITPMRAVVFTEYTQATTKAIKIATINQPIITRPTDVLIKVVACSLNPVDYKIVNGALRGILDITPPAVLSYDLAGIVEKVGSSVTQFKAGDEVYSRVDHDRMGTAAEYAITSEQSVAMKPKSLSFDEAASIPLAGLTALQALRNARLQSGDCVLILGSSGGVGSIAVQLASQVFGASEVIATASSSNFDMVKSLGATQLIDYKTEKYAEKVKDIDVVFNTAADNDLDSFSIMKSGGRAVSIVAPYLPSALEQTGIKVSTVTGATLTASAATAFASAALHNITYDAIWTKPSGADLAELAGWIDEGKIKPVIDKVYQFEQAVEAFDYLSQGHVKGKLVLHVQNP